MTKWGVLLKWENSSTFVGQLRKPYIRCLKVFSMKELLSLWTPTV